MQRVPNILLLLCGAFLWVHLSSEEPLLHNSVNCSPCNCTQDVTTGDITANCSNLGLEKLPPLPNTTTVLLLNNCNLTSFSSDAFQQLPRLRLLNVSYCRLTNISREAFAPLSHLETLDISCNPNLGLDMLTTALRGFPVNASLRLLNASEVVSELTIGVTVGLELAEALQLLPLEELVMDSNQIEAVCDGVLQRLPVSLTKLSVRRNRFRPGLYMFSLHELKNLVRLAAGEQFPSFDAFDAWERNFSSPTLQESETVHFLSTLILGMDAQATIPSRWAEEMKLEDNACYSQRFSQATEEGSSTLSTDERLCYSAESKRKTLVFLKQLYHQNTFTIRLPPKLEYCEMEYNYMSFPLRNLTIDAPNLKELQLARNNFSVMLGPIWGVYNLESLDLSYGRGGLVLSPSFFSLFPNLTNLVLYGNYLGFLHALDIPPFTKLTSLKSLNLDFNYIYTLPPNFLEGLDKLENLELYLNSLSNWTLDISHMHNLEGLDIHLNYFTSIPIHLRNQLDALCKERENKSLHCVGLFWYKNHYECNCNTLDSLRWLLQYPGTIWVANTTCTLVSDTTVYIGSYKNLTMVVGMLEHACSNYVIMVVSSIGCLLICLGLLLGALLYRYRWRLRYLFYRKKAKVAEMMAMAAAEEGRRDHFFFDVFVSYADDDRSFVVKEMRQKLERERNIRLCIHHRDFMPGREIATNICDAVRCSRRTLVLLTPQFLQSYWCRYELNMARMEELHEGRRVLVLLLYQHVPPHLLNCDLLELMRRDSYLELPLDEEEEGAMETFYENLTAALFCP